MFNKSFPCWKESQNCKKIIVHHFFFPSVCLPVSACLLPACRLCFRLAWLPFYFHVSLPFHTFCLSICLLKNWRGSACMPLGLHVCCLFHPLCGCLSTCQSAAYSTLCVDASMSATLPLCPLSAAYSSLWMDSRMSACLHSALLSAAYSSLCVDPRMPACLHLCPPVCCLFQSLCGSQLNACLSPSLPACLLSIPVSLWIPACLLVSFCARLSAAYSIICVDLRMPAWLPLCSPVCYLIHAVSLCIPECLLFYISDRLSAAYSIICVDLRMPACPPSACLSAA